MSAQDAGLYQVGDRVAVASRTNDDGMFVDNAFAELVPDGTDPAAVGAAIRRAWRASLELPPASVQEPQAILELLGFPNEDALMKAGARQVFASIIRGRVKVTATENEGPRHGFRGIQKFEGLAPEASDEELGTLALKALSQSR